MTDSPHAISVQSLSKSYGARAAVDDLTTDVPAGVVAGFVGPNGAGKTTTMAMLLGLIEPSGGTGTVLGRPLADPASYLRHVGALIETPAYYPGLTGAENLAVLATVAGHDPAQIPELLELVGLHGRGDDRFGRYSLGMKQRLGIAGALLGDPALLILDEPTNGLDPAGVTEARHLIAGLAQGGRTVLISSHNLVEVEHVCDWLVVLDHGALVYQGSAAELLDRSASSVIAVPERAGDLDALQRLATAAGHPSQTDAGSLVVPVNGTGARDLAAALHRAAAAGGIVLVELRATRTTLEDRYLHLVTGGDR